MFRILLVTVSSAVLISSAVPVENEICDSSYLQNAESKYIEVADLPEDPDSLADRIIRSLPGRRVFAVSNNSDVKQICEPFVDDDVKGVILIDIGLKYVKPGSFVKPRIPFILHLAENHLEYIQDGIFSDTKIAYLDLSHNDIQTIDENAFDNMPYLEVLKLDNNKIESWNANWFSNSPSIHYISIQHNLLSSVPKHALKNVKGSQDIQDISVYSVIDFGYNRITTIHPKAFIDQKLFGRINLNSNSMTSIPLRIFHHFDSLQELDMSDNPIICFSKTQADEELNNVQNLSVFGIDVKEEC